MQKGTVYLLHFAEPLAGRAKHYIGFTGNLNQRLKQHRAGYGAAITRACNKVGIQYTLAQAWPDKDRNFERELKDRKKTKQFCPVCQAELLLFDKKALKALERPGYRMVIRAADGSIAYTQGGYRSFADAVCVGREIIITLWKGHRLAVERYK